MGSYYPCVNPWIALSWPILDGALSALRGMSIEETVAWAEGRAEPQPLPGNRLLTPGQCQPERTLDIDRWRRQHRALRLRRVVARATECKWSHSLLCTLLDELHVSEDVKAALGSIRKLPRTRYPQAVAYALVLRHSWRPDDLRRLLRRLRLPHCSDARKSPPRDLSDRVVGRAKPVVTRRPTAFSRQH